MSRADAEFVNGMLTLHPLAISPQCTANVISVLQEILPHRQPDNCYGGPVHALQTLLWTAAGRPCRIRRHGSRLRCTCVECGYGIHFIELGPADHRVQRQKVPSSPTDAVVRLGCVVAVNEVLHGTHKEFSASTSDPLLHLRWP
jgi:hypothetical protein